MFLYKEIDKWCPDAKFILTIRDAECVANSDINMWIKSGAEKNSIPAKEIFINRYLNHKKAVINYFYRRKNKLLIIDLTTEEKLWQKLCSFLDKEIPKLEFPHVNKGKYENEVFFNRLKKFIKTRIQKLRNRL